MGLETPIAVSVAVVDDHPVVRDGLCAMIAAEPDLQLVAEIGSGQEALEIIPKLRPTVVIVDLLMPGIGGIEIIQEVCKKSSDISFIVLTSLVGDEEIYRALEAGARGYLFKDMARKDLIRAIRTVGKGKRYIPDQVGSRIAENFPRSTVTDREVEVLQFVASGMRNKEIALQMGLTETTVHSHLKNIMSKLCVDDRTSAVLCALRRGIIRL